MIRIRGTAEKAKQALDRLLAKGRKPRKPKTPTYTAECVELFPDKLKADRLYLAGDGKEFWGAALLCPCACGDTIQLNLLTQVRPAWRVIRKGKTTITLEPSVWRQKGCRSHFFLRNGKIQWC